MDVFEDNISHHHNILSRVRTSPDGERIPVTALPGGQPQLPSDEVRDIDPELEKLWFEARERHLGFLSSYSFEVPGGAAASTEQELRNLFSSVQLSMGPRILLAVPITKKHL